MPSIRLDQSNGTLTESISGNGAGQFGVINLANAVLLEAGSDLTIDLVGGYDPANGTKSFTITDPTFNGGTQQWTISYNGGDITLTAGASGAPPPTLVTATWGNVAPSANSTGNWTTAAEWSCTPPATPANCVPNNGTPANTNYAAILDSTGNTLTLNTAETVNSTDIQAGTLEIDGGTLTLNGGAATVEIGAFLSSDGSSTVNGTGTFTNNGTVTVNSGTLNLVNAGVTNLAADTLTGGLWQAGNGVNSGVIQFNSDITTNSAGIILENPGSQIQDSLGNDAIAGLTANNGGGLTLFNGATESITPGTGTFTNGNGSGIDVAFGGSSLTINGALTNSGGSTINVNGAGGGATLDVTGNLTNQDTSTITVSGHSVANGAELTGNGGTITGNLINDGTLSPGTGAAPGTLTVNGNINLAGATGANDGTFLELIAGLNNFGVLDDTDPTGVATLGGTLDVMLLGGYQPVVGNTFTFIDPFSDVGVFTTLDLPAAPAGDEYIVQYNAASTELCFVSSANPVCGAAAAPPPVPEPKSVVLLGTVIAAALWIHRKRRQKLAASA